MSEERVIFNGASSGVVNAGAYALCAVVAIAVVVGSLLVAQPLVVLLVLAPLLYAGWVWLANRSRVYEITSERIRVRQGILTHKTEELELYRVEDMTVVEPFFYRVFGVGNIVLTTNDSSNPTLTLEALRGLAQVREELRQAVEDRREKKRVRVTEIE
jgi:membrane protein YdbS with pleckstrin-like domain